MKQFTKKEEKKVYRKGLLHHHYRFRHGLWQNVKIWFCRTFGHEVNTNVEHKWCERCGLFYGEIYHKPEDWGGKI